jgi:KaiC/GvpD/RAD55 family RecA-like ATPase
MPTHLRFGIPSLDLLFGAHREAVAEDSTRQTVRAERGQGILVPGGKDQDSRRGSVSICISGPDGTGKSILGLHLASRYLADCYARERWVAVRKFPRDKQIVLPRILYVSTDLKFKMAEKMWLNFGLDVPNQRSQPFVESQTPSGLPLYLNLRACAPFGGQGDVSEPLADCLIAQPQPASPRLSLPANWAQADVLFIDLAAQTAGDDWGFVNRMLALLEPLESHQPRHLLVLDSVEGFETMVGERDAFGEVQPRRSRIAQIMRSAADKCHTLFVVEEPEEGKRLPEEFVTDVVIRLRSVLVKDYARRTLEIEKARGHSHVRGQHAYLIRSGVGSTTGRQRNPDEPRLPAFTELDSARLAKGGQARAPHQSYLHVCHSLHHLNREIMSAEGGGRPALLPARYAAFGIRHLDEMLGGQRYGFTRTQGDDQRGLQCSTTTALIGNSETQKSPLGYAFLSRCFREYAKRFQERIELLQKWPAARFQQRLAFAKQQAEAWREGDRRHRKPHTNEERRAEIFCRLEEIGVFADGKGSFRESTNAAAAPADPNVYPVSDLIKLAAWKLGHPRYPADGIPVLLTTMDIHAEELALKFLPWLLRKVPQLKRWEQLDEPEAVPYRGCIAALRLHMEQYTICRRLEIHDLPSAVFFHIVKCAIETAQSMLHPRRKPMDTEGRFRLSWGIRVVIDDLSILKNTYVEIRDEPLWLRFLVFYLGREGVTTLLIDTQPGQPDMAASSLLDSEMRSLVHNHLYTWRFSFYGETRVAIAPIPPTSPERPAVIRELRFVPEEAARPELDLTPLVVDPHFELYAGIEKGEPKPIALQVRLFAETENFKTYIEDGNSHFLERFVSLPAACDTDADKILVGVPITQYDKLREFCYLLRGTRLDHSLLFQIDEFWYLRRTAVGRSGAFRSQKEYLCDAVAYTVWQAEAAGSAEQWVRDWAADPFGLFQHTATGEQGDRDQPVPRNSAGKKGEPSKPYRRHNEFGCHGYAFETSKEQQARKKKHGQVEQPSPPAAGHAQPSVSPSAEPVSDPRTPPPETIHPESIPISEFVDRVPFMWDFGFLLCRKNQWVNSLDAELTVWTDTHRDEPKKYVRNVWERLPLALEEKKEQPSPVPRATWREFLEACQQVARAESYRLATPVPAFDLHAIAAQSFSCLVLEIWMSEICQRLWKATQGFEKNEERLDWEKNEAGLPGSSAGTDSDPERRFNAFVHGLAERKWDFDQPEEGLLEWLGREAYQRDLFKVWLLLVEALDFVALADAVRGNGLSDKECSPHAVAVRHWYKTACRATEGMSPNDPLIPVGLPGHFATRGDWFLGVAGGSRSSRLADRALDLLNSRRANYTRLNLGLGLPVRRIENDVLKHLDTGLWTMDQGRQLAALPLGSNYRLRKVRYENLLKLGQPQDKPDAADFHWLWRSSLKRYYRHARIWQDWLCRQIQRWERLRYLESNDTWVNGFKRYDWIEKGWWEGLQEEVRDEEGKLVLGADGKPQTREIAVWEYFKESCLELQKDLREATRAHPPH